LDSDPFQGRLLNGERLVWQGRPAAGILFTNRDFLLVPFSLFWCGFVIFWEWGAWHTSTAMPDDPMGTVFPLFGIPFILIGLYFLAGRFFADAWIRDRTSYAVTSQRVLIFRAPPLGKFTSLAIDRLPELSLNERSDGRGTILFQPAQPMWNTRSWSSWTPALDTTQFLMIPDARSVFDRIQKQGTKAGG
jgi:hypothetical protein